MSATKARTEARLKLYPMYYPFLKRSGTFVRQTSTSSTLTGEGVYRRGISVSIEGLYSWWDCVQMRERNRQAVRYNRLLVLVADSSSQLVSFIYNTVPPRPSRISFPWKRDPNRPGIDEAQRFSAARGHTALEAMIRMEMVIYIAVEVITTVEPRAGADKDAVGEPFRSVISGGCAAVRGNVVVTVGAVGCDSDIDSDLCLCQWGGSREADSRCGRND